MSKELRIGFIGCGGIAISKHLSALSKIKEVELVGFCDLILDQAEEAKEKVGSPVAKTYTDYRKLLEDQSINVVHICTPNRSHSEIAVAALEAGKHVMCEKPMAINSMEARKMLEASKRTGKKLTIGYQNRFRPDSQYLHELCLRGELGEIYFAKAHAIRRRAVPTWGVFLNESEQGGGPLIDIGTHALDLTLWMMNNYQPKYVVGRTFHKLSQTQNAANAWGPWDPEQFTVEDSAFGFIVMENGATIILESSWALNTLDEGEAKTTLCGTKGGADMREGLRLNGERLGKLYTTNVMLDGQGVAYYDSKQDDPADLEARMWIDCLLNNTEPLVKPEEALVVTEILEAIYESAKTGTEVRFD
ncbi:MAG TPA: oxidoreductase [Firmicutes bacterium]|jgi:predicted dehydrogenase|nr:oxidoreductase [Bacillota bacterium]